MEDAPERGPTWSPSRAPLRIGNNRLFLVRTGAVLVGLFLFYSRDPLAVRGAPLHGTPHLIVTAALALGAYFFLRGELLWVELGDELRVRTAFTLRRHQLFSLERIELLTAEQTRARAGGRSALFPHGMAAILHLRESAPIELEVEPNEVVALKRWAEEHQVQVGAPE